MKKTILLLSVLFGLFMFSANAEESFAEFSFTVKGSDFLKCGDTVECEIEYKNIGSTGLSSAEVIIGYTDGVKFNNDVFVVGLDDSWSLWSPNVSRDKIKMAIVDDSTQTPGRNDIKITFSFTVVSDTVTLERIELLENSIYDFDINEVTEDCSVTLSDESFLVNLPKIEIKNMGASLRINNSPAIRFAARCDIADGVKVKPGMLVAKTTELSGELNHFVQSAIVCDFVKNNGEVFITKDFEISSNTEKYTFRPFVLVELADSTEHIIYFDTLERSAEDISGFAIENETDPKKLQLLQAFLN